MFPQGLKNYKPRRLEKDSIADLRNMRPKLLYLLEFSPKSIPKNERACANSVEVVLLFYKITILSRNYPTQEKWVRSVGDDTEHPASMFSESIKDCLETSSLFNVG